MPALNSPQDMLAYELKAIHSAERQVSRALPRLMKKISSEQLRSLLEKRLEQGTTLIEEVDDVLEEMETAKARPKNMAAEGLIDEATGALEDVEEDSLVDPLVVASVQKLEHYCIAAWGTVAALGRLLEQENVVQVMERALEEGKRFDEELTEVAESEVNQAMMEAGEEEGEEEEEEQSQGKNSSGRSGRRTAAKSGKSRGKQVA